MMSMCSPLADTRHGICQKQRRGITGDAMRLVWENFDSDVLIGSGCVAVSISSAMKETLMIEGRSPQLVDRAANLCLVLSEINGHIVTVMHLFGRKGRSYRHQGAARGIKIRR